MQLQCFLLGEFKVLRDGVPITGWRRPSVSRLFKLVLLAPGHVVSMSEVCTALWPDKDVSSKLRQRLHHQVYLLNKVLVGEVGENAARPVMLSAGALRLSDSGGVWLDTRQFEAALDALAGSPQDSAALERALALYKGVLLPGDADDEAFEHHRSQLAQRYVNGLHVLANAHLRAGNQLAAVNALQRILQHMPAEESAHRALIELYGRAGQLAQADNQFALCKQALMRAFAMVPDEATLRAYRHAMQGAQSVQRPGTEARHAAPPAGTAPLAEEKRFYAPASVVQLIGRDALIARYSHQIAEGAWRLFTLLGVGGVGKTQLAVRLAHEMNSRFKHGTCFVALAEVDQAQVPERIARALGVREQPHRPLPESIAQFLQQKHLLLVLDNFEHVLPSVSLLTPWLQACPLLTIVCTSRVRLNAAAECVLEVPVLGAQPQSGAANAAVELFVQRAVAVQPRFAMAAEDRDDVQAIVQALGGLPLALELAAARLPMYGLRGLREALTQHHEIVVAGGGQDRPQRHRSLAASMAWSFGLLDRTQQRALHALALFVEPFDARAAAQVCAAAVPDIAQSLQVLVDAGLVTPQVTAPDGEPAYSLHSLTREFLAQQPRNAQEAHSDARALMTYLCTVAQAMHTAMENGELARAIRGFTAHHSGFFSALEMAELAGDVKLIAKMVGHLALYWARTGTYSNAARWVLRARGLAGQLPADERGRLMLVLGYYFVSASNPLEARACAQQAIGCAQQIGDERLHARAGLLLSGTVVALGSPESGIQVLEQARRYALVAQDQELLQKIGVNLGVCYLQSGDIAAAGAEWAACNGWFKRQKTQARVSAVSNLALIAQYRGRTGRAQRLSQFALQLEQRGQAQPNRVLHILLRQVWMLCCNAQPDAARQVLARAGEVIERAALPNMEEVLLFQRGKIHACLGNLEQAAAQLASAAQELPGRADPWDVLDSRIWLFWTLHRQGADAAATAPLLHTLLASVHGWRQERPRVLEAAAAWLANTHAWAGAQAAWQAAHAQRMAAGVQRFAAEEPLAQQTQQLIAHGVCKPGKKQSASTRRGVAHPQPAADIAALVRALAG